VVSVCFLECTKKSNFSDFNKMQERSVLGGGEECLDDVVDKRTLFPALAHKIELDVRIALMSQLDVT
jgi:hypothetical protein